MNNHDHRQLPAELRAHAYGVLCAEAAAEILISHRTWLYREDFVDTFVNAGWELASDVPMAYVNWPAALTALDAGSLPCSSSEAQILRIAASIAEGIPVDLRENLTSLDTYNTNLVTRAVIHTAGHRRQLGTD
jgi:hypothetical protein